MTSECDVLVTGAGGFVGGHLVHSLLEDGYSVRAVDIKPAEDWWQRFDEAQNFVLDLSHRESAFAAVKGCSMVYNLAADMGGIGYISSHKIACMLSVLINTNLIQAACQERVERYFFASSACVYSATKQSSTDSVALKESDAYPAMPEDGYGWEKLFSERLCRHYYDEAGLETRVARYHNMYGELGSWEGGREKAPAAICRKVAIAKCAGLDEISIWGDGNQTRTFMYVGDGVIGTKLITTGEFADPVNLGSSEVVSVNDLVTIVETIAGITLRREYELDAPQGVRGRASNNDEILRRYRWQPSVSLADGIERTYGWVYDQVKARYGS